MTHPKPLQTVPDFDAEKHLYSINGVVKQNVTSILQDVKPVFYKNNPVALNRGTYYHELCHAEAQGILDHTKLEAEPDEVFRQEQMGIAVAYSTFLADNNLGKEKPLCEQPLWHSKLDYCGTPDQIFFDSNVMVDLKFGQKQKNHRLQMAAYYLLIIDNYRIMNNKWKCIVLYIDIENPGTYKQEVIVIDNNLLNIWHSFLNVSRW